MTASVKREKPGPDPERLKIEGDPEEGLKKLLTPPPPEKDEPVPQEAEPPQRD